MKTSHKNARFQVLSGVAEDSILVGCDSLGRWLPLLPMFIVSSFSGSGSQRGANLEDEDTMAD